MELDYKHIANTRLMTSRDDLLTILPKYCNVAEIGVYRGAFAKKIYDITKPKKLHLIDLWNNDSLGQPEDKILTEQKFVNCPNVYYHTGNSLDILPQFISYFDWLYLDSNHKYKHTKKELKLCKKCIKKGGLICAHDYTIGNFGTPGQYKYYGVIDAVNEFCIENNFEIIYLTNESDRFLSVVLKEIC